MTLMAAVLLGALLPMAKPSGTLEELLRTADAVALGSIQDVRPTGDERIRTATLVPAVWIKGSPGPGRVPVSVYASGASEGLTSLWLLKQRPGGGLQETYPWLRCGPARWPDLPDTERRTVWQAVAHAEGPEQDGLRLHLMRVPSHAGEPLSVWLGIESRAGLDHAALVHDPDHPDAVQFRIVGPDGARETVPLLRQADVDLLRKERRGTDVQERTPRIVLARRPAETARIPEQITLVPEAKAGRYHVEATLSSQDRKVADRPGKHTWKVATSFEIQP